MAVTDCIRTCRQCGKEMDSSIGRRREYCGVACQAESKKIRRRGYNLKPRPETRWRDATCRRCKQPFRSRPSGSSEGGWTRYCCRECAQQGRHWAAGDSKDLRPIVVRTFHWHCDQCGRAYHRSNAQRSRYCGHDCYMRSVHTKHEPRPCRVCRTMFTPGFRLGPPMVCCSKKCDAERVRRTRRAAKARREHATRGRRAQTIDAIRVFERDHWRCHLCGCKTPRELRGTYDPRAPELDHIVALADGGTHTWGNVACACRACNGAKGARSMGQLGLGFAA